MYKKIIGPKGNIFVPTYSYSFSDKKPKVFDLHNTKSKIGSFQISFSNKKIL